ncbi:transglycosylase domain-containing protein [Peptoniphilus sp.]|uniref:transglycosylase domain-containing protein n=1 Tax=Peptoniphilus sp. TaxID=1971214 RepID=UPI003996B1E5
MKRNNKKKKAYRISSFFKVLILLILIAIITLGSIAGCYLVSVLKKAPPIEPENYREKLFETSRIYDSNGDLLQRLVKDEYAEFVSYDNIPKDLKNAIVAVEDERFFQHSAVDFKRLAGALYYDLMSGRFDQGGSTITMQLAKNLYTSRVQKIERKLMDIYYAYQIEDALSKEEILEAYLNSAGFSKGTVGVQAASKMFFGKNVSDLTLAECALIAGVTNLPEYYTPYNRVNITDEDDLSSIQFELVPVDTSQNENIDKIIEYSKSLLELGRIDKFDLHLIESNQIVPMKAQFNERSLERQHKILKNMLNQEMIDQGRYDEAMNQPIVLNISNRSQSGISSYFVDTALKETKEILINAGFSKEDAESELYRGGLNIYTSMNTQIQQSLEETVQNTKYYPGNSLDVNGDPQPQVGSVIIDNKTRKVVALVGGRGLGGGSLANRATIPRQPGSAIKPIGPYLTAFNHGATAGDVYLDANLKYVNLPYIQYKPSNVGSYVGWTTIRKLLVRSSNVGAYLVSRDIHTDFKDRKNRNSTYSQHVNNEANLNSIIETLENLGVTTVDKVNDLNYAALSLGGMTRGISPLEIAGAFTVFPNEGQFEKPTFVDKIVTNTGDVIYERKDNLVEVADKRDAYILTDILKEVVTSGTGRNARVKGQVTAGKTGTTNDKKEAWFVGFTPYYTASVLLAKDNHESLGFSSTTAATLFKAIMDPIHEGLDKVDYDKPDGIYRKYVNGRYEMFKDDTSPRNVDKLYWGQEDDEDEDKKSDDKKKKDNNNDSNKNNEDSNDSKSKKKKRKTPVNNNDNNNNR